jgi:hypothetical protein
LGEAIRGVTASTSMTPPTATSPYLAQPLPKVGETNGIALVLEQPDFLHACDRRACPARATAAAREGAKSGLITPVG